MITNANFIAAVLASNAKHLFPILAAAKSEELMSQEDKTPLQVEMRKAGVDIEMENFDITYVVIAREHKAGNSEALLSYVEAEVEKATLSFMQLIQECRTDGGKHYENALPYNIRRLIDMHMVDYGNYCRTRFNAQQKDNHYSLAEMRGEEGRSFPIRETIKSFNDMMLPDYADTDCPQDTILGRFYKSNGEYIQRVFMIYAMTALRQNVETLIAAWLKDAN